MVTVETQLEIEARNAKPPQTPTEEVITLPSLVISILQLEEAEVMQEAKATLCT